MTKNPFSRYDIDHLSPSSLNLYAAEPAFWSLVYLHGHKDETGPAAWRGSAVEAGVDAWLYKRDLQEATQAGINSFEANALGELSRPIDAERGLVPAMVKQACGALQSCPEPTARQLKIEYWFDGIEVPVIGFVDYEFEGHGFDLKTVRRMPSEMPPRHARQIALYAAARKKPYSGLYVTDKKAEVKQVEDAETHLKRLQWYAHSIRRLLSIFSDKHDVSRIFAPNFDTFYWSSEESKRLAKEIWE